MTFDGGLYTEAPDSPHTLLSRVKARVYFGHGAEDRSMPPEVIEKFNRALAVWGGNYESEVYQAHHGWTVPDSSSRPTLEPQRQRRLSRARASSPVGPRLPQLQIGVFTDTALVIY
jgi:carboxymethylenebutenolidase